MTERAFAVLIMLMLLYCLQAPFCGMHPGQLLNAKLTHLTSQLLPLPDSAPAALASLCLACWEEEPSQRPSMQGVIEQLNGMALQLLGDDQAMLVFPDLARHVMAQRRSAAAAVGIQ
jgi:acyl carrier protein phosphodiesterase